MKVRYEVVNCNDLEKIEEIAIMRVKKEDEKNGYNLTNNTKQLIKDNTVNALKKNNILTVIAYDEDSKTTMAMGTLVINDDLPSGIHPEPSYYGLISNVYTNVEFRNKGLCKNIISRIIKIAQTKELNFLLLQTHSDIARRIYKSVGFTEYDESLVFKVKL